MAVASWAGVVTNAGWSSTLGVGDWTSIEISAAASYTITPPVAGTHLAVELQLRGDTVATETGLAVKLNGDTTTGDYHWQRLGANNGAGAQTEGTTFDVALIAAASAVADHYSSVSLFFPEFRNARQKLCIVTCAGEHAALNQRIFVAVHKRQTAGVGALTDAITSIQLVPSAGNISGTIRYAVVAR